MTSSAAVDRFFQVAIENVSDAIEVTDATGHFAYVNPAWKRLTGYSAAEAVGKTPRLLRSNYHSEEYYDDAYRSVVEQGAWSGELVSRRKDGKLIFTLVSLTSVYDPDGRARHRVAVRRDLTGELSRIREHADRFALAMLATRDGLSDWDIATGEVFTSERWKEITGVDHAPAELAQWFQAALHPDDAGRFGAELSLHLEGRDRFFEAEFRMIRPDGAVVHLEHRAITVRDDEGNAVRVVAALADVTERKATERRLFHGATHDGLTDLPNRSLFVDHVRAAIGRASRVDGPAFSLLYIDLRHFKSVNDAYGHAAGDALLRSIARRLQATVRPGDSLARLGGDEFAVLLDGVVSEDVADAAARRILRQLERPHEIDGSNLVISATIGVTLGDAHSDVDQLVRAADSAMYEARRSDRHPVALSTDGTAAASHRRARMVGALRDALAARAIDVVYQPIVRVRGNGLVGAEALARWTHPELGVVPPSEFVPLAEESQLAGRLGAVVLERTLDDLGRWIEDGLIGPDFVVHVNVSPHQLLDPRLLSHLARLSAAGRLPPGRLCLEITETALVGRPEAVVQTIEAARAYGVTFALDDFGTGYSSLSHLRRFAVSTVKIDRSFVMQLPGDPVSREIVAGLLTMTRALGMSVVAEGVEGTEHERWLDDLGCHLAQGYLYAKPAPVAAFNAWVRENQQRTGVPVA